MSTPALCRFLAVAMLAGMAATTTLGSHAGDRAQPSSVYAANDHDAATHLHTYRYTVSNPGGNTAPIDSLVVLLEPGVDVVTGFTSPPGWRAFHSADQGKVMWAATGYRDPEVPAPDGNITPSDYAIAPGASLGGFSFKSFGTPGAGPAITQSFAPLRTPDAELEMEALEAGREHSTLPEDNGFSVSTIVPVPDADWTGNRRPSVDGFLVFANVRAKSLFSTSALIVFRLGSAAESVDASTLRVMLNGVDVTALVAWNEEFNGYAMRFLPGVSPLRNGSNVLRTSVQGIVPGTERRVATDTDRLRFEFTP